MGDMDRPGACPFCPYCSRRMELVKWFRSWWRCACGHYYQVMPENDDRHREAMRLAGLLEDDE